VAGRVTTPAAVTPTPAAVTPTPAAVTPTAAAVTPAAPTVAPAAPPVAATRATPAAASATSATSAAVAAATAAAATAPAAATAVAAAILSKGDATITGTEGNLKVGQERHDQERHDHQHEGSKFRFHRPILPCGTVARLSQRRPKFFDSFSLSLLRASDGKIIEQRGCQKLAADADCLNLVSSRHSIE